MEHTNKYKDLPYNPETLPRELTEYYISASQEEIQTMLSEVGAKSEADLFSHIREEVKFQEAPNIGKKLEYGDLIVHMQNLAKKNNPKLSFIGDGLPISKQPEVTGPICDIRGLTTAYTPYQPERSQGTLTTLWIYSSTLSMLTGFEAINASFYDRSTCLFEACNTATRLKKNADTVLVSTHIYPRDIEVLKTQAIETNLKIELIDCDKETGRINLKQLQEKISELGESLAGFVFPQISTFGPVENSDDIVDLCDKNNIKTILIFDPLTLGTDGLKQPAKYGSNSQGVTMIVGEGQHLALAPNFGGPGLGIFGIRYNENDKNSIRSTAGRYVGKAKDQNGQSALAMILSTREQHIRREKAMSNICSNQSFLATIAGAGILERGEKGFQHIAKTLPHLTKNTAIKLAQYEEVSLAFNESLWNEIVLEIDRNPTEFINKVAKEEGVHIGVDLKNRNQDKKNYLKITISDSHTTQDIEKLVKVFDKFFTKTDKKVVVKEIPSQNIRKEKVDLPNLSTKEIIEYYQKLGTQNVSPDDDIYPLGSCTMKYNPYINDYAASLKGFTDIHPQAPEFDCQGSLEILYETQELFQKITGLKGLTTEPVAGAQGELVGLKMFQAYHRDRGNGETKNIILIPRSAHGTNPATATMAGYDTKKVNGIPYGIVTIDSYEDGTIDMEQLQKIVDEHGKAIAGIMVTNPNTSGVFETKFKEMAELIHSVDGLVYMDGANMNAIAGWVNLDKLGVDAVHNNLHKTWTIPHGGGGPGDAIVAVSDRLYDYLPGIQVKKTENGFETFKTDKSIGSFHRHYGNFAHKVRCYTYIKALGSDGVRKMSAVAVLSARYLYEKLKGVYPSLPAGADNNPRMHEFIITIEKEMFDHIQNAGTPKNNAIAKIGKLFLDFGLHAPTVAFPEQFGLMIEPTESFSKSELDRFLEVLKAIKMILTDAPAVLKTTPHFTPVKKIDEVEANKNVVLSEKISSLPKVYENIIEPGALRDMNVSDVMKKINESHLSSC